MITLQQDVAEHFERLYGTYDERGGKNIPITGLDRALFPKAPLPEKGVVRESATRRASAPPST